MNRAIWGGLAVASFCLALAVPARASEDLSWSRVLPEGILSDPAHLVPLDNEWVQGQALLLVMADELVGTCPGVYGNAVRMSVVGMRLREGAMQAGLSPEEAWSLTRDPEIREWLRARAWGWFQAMDLKSQQDICMLARRQYRVKSPLGRLLIARQ